MVSSISGEGGLPLGLWVEQSIILEHHDGHCFFVIHQTISLLRKKAIYN